ncbi:type IV pilus assembly protein PilM [Candidatus Curtissbacteria bacterium]|nr:type IV pilus assembly protein PilM [Candidatus Curtissbacteria bacterium]
MASGVFGLDIGRSFVKVVQIKSTGNKKMLIGAGTTVTPGGGIMSESPIELKKVADSIKSCVETAKIDTDKCAVSLIESQVVSRLISFPTLTDKELSAAISWEAEQYIPLPIKDVNLQYKVITRPAAGSNEKMSVLLVAAPKRVIAKYINVVKNAGLTIAAMETESAALVRSLTQHEDPTTIIVSMGALSTELVIIKSGSIVFTRSIATGGFNLTKAISSEFNLPQNQAEQYKHAYGLDETKLGGKVAAVLKPILDILVSEILKAVEFSHTHVGEAPVVRLIITGGGSFLPGLSSYLTEKTSLEVTLGDPWLSFAKEGIITKLAGQGSVYSVATGLALRS